MHNSTPASVGIIFVKIKFFLKKIKKRIYLPHNQIFYNHSFYNR